MGPWSDTSIRPPTAASPAVPTPAPSPAASPTATPLTDSRAPETSRPRRDPGRAALVACAALVAAYLAITPFRQPDEPRWVAALDSVAFLPQYAVAAALAWAAARQETLG